MKKWISGYATTAAKLLLSLFRSSARIASEMLLSKKDRDWIEQEKKREIKAYIKDGCIVTDIPSLVNSDGFKRQMKALESIFRGR